MTSVLEPVAQKLGVDIPVLDAVLRVESRGLGHGLVNGRPVIRLEVHKLWDYVPIGKRDAVNLRFNVAGVDVDVATTSRYHAPAGVETARWKGHQFFDGKLWQPMHRPGDAGQDGEWRALSVACDIDYSASVKATSWGLGQILGRWKELGFDSPAGFVSAQMNEAKQLDTFARYVALSPRLVQALRDRDWEEVALLYNGNGKVTHYAARLADAYRDALKAPGS